MNPFDLPGPQFLVFYALFAIVVIAMLYVARSYYESGSPPSLDLVDPLLFACLRGGPKEVVRVATLGLIDRGILQATGSTVTRSPKATPALVRRPIEKEVLSYFNAPADIDSILQRPSVLRVAEEEYEDQLRRYQLIPDADILKMRFLFLIAALVAVIGVGGTKLMIAVGAGRSNIGFLIVMMAVAVFVAIKLRGPYRTAVGESYLASICSMFTGLQERAASIRPGNGSRDLLWLTALFGAATLPASAFPFVQHLWPKPRTASGSGCSSCGGGGGSSGCGGGGGGGGCGGCGS